MDIQHTYHQSYSQSTNMAIPWEDCDTLINDAANDLRPFSIPTPGEVNMMNGNGVSLGLYQGNLHHNMQHQQQLPMHQVQHPSMIPTSRDNMNSLSPDSTSSQSTAMNLHHSSPSYSSPMMAGEPQIKMDPYLNDGLHPMKVYSEHNNDYLHNSSITNSNMFPLQQHEQISNASPPVSRVAGKAKRRNTFQTDTQMKGDLDDNTFRSGDSNSNEEEDIAIKRKAQNRAAQRAFRERKEQRVRELEQKLGESEKEKLRLVSENERLKKENTVISTENQVLVATTDKTGGYSPRGPSIPLRANFPVHKFSTMLLAHHPEPAPSIAAKNNQGPSYVVYEKKGNDVMLGAGAVWERIMQEPDSDDIDVESVMKFLIGKEHCDGFGPVFSLDDVQTGIAMARNAY